MINVDDEKRQDETRRKLERQETETCKKGRRAAQVVLHVLKYTSREMMV